VQTLPNDGPASAGLQVKHVLRIPGQRSHASMEVRALGVGHDLKMLLPHRILFVTDRKERDWHRSGVGEAAHTQGGECDLCRLLDGLIQLDTDDGCHPRLRRVEGYHDVDLTLVLAMGRSDEDINTLATIIPSIEILGPITRSRAQQLNHQVNSFLCSSVYNIEGRLLHNDLIVLRNQGEDHGGQTEHQEGAGEPRRRAQEGGEPIQFGIAEFESNSESRTTSY
jgi:hypothetical protein